jgi:ParB-like chromosome segregation protein Spo0J
MKNLNEIKAGISELLTEISINEKIDIINSLREHIHNLSPFINEPVDFVKWVVSTDVVANDYNPNKVAPPEMELLEISIINDGYTQPIVTWPREDKIEVIDGFHRHRVGSESKLVRERIMGYLPTVMIRKEQSEKNDRIASTIRHNRARGKHVVSAMSDIVIELKRRNWSDERVAKELGMDADEVLRLCQISGLAEAFENEDFSEAWVSEIFDEDYVNIDFEQNDTENLS